MSLIESGIVFTHNRHTFLHIPQSLLNYLVPNPTETLCRYYSWDNDTKSLVRCNFIPSVLDPRLIESKDVELRDPEGGGLYIKARTQDHLAKFNIIDTSVQRLGHSLPAIWPECYLFSFCVLISTMTAETGLSCGPKEMVSERAFSLIPGT